MIQALHSALIIQAFGNYAVLLEQQFAWSKTSISIAYSLNRSESGLLGPIQGWALQRFNSRLLMRLGIGVLSLGFVFLSRIETVSQFIMAFFVLAIGSGLSGFMTVTTETVKWFERYRATALSLTLVGAAVGGLFTPAVVWSLQTLGWRDTAALSAVIVILVGMPLSSVFGHSPMERARPRGVSAALRPNSQRREPITAVQFSARQALRTQAFWMLSLGHTCALVVVGAVIAHLSLYLTTEQGFTLQQAGLVGAALTLFQLFGILVGGYLGDRMSKRVLCSSAMAGHMVGFLFLAFAKDASFIWMFVVLHGLAWGLRSPLMGGLRADYFGSTAFGQIMGYSSVILTVGIVGGPLLAGFLADVTGSYRAGFTALTALAGCGLAFFALASPPLPPERPAAVESER